MKVDQQSPGTGGGGGGMIAHEYGVSFRGDENIPELDRGGGSITL